MKRFLSLFLALLTAIPLFGCAGNAPAETTEAPGPTQTPEEAEVLKILVIGNSHSNDAFWLLWEAFRDQLPDQKVVLGIMYYSGCPIDKHVKFYTEKQAVYEYHRNMDGTWETMEEVCLEHGLRDQAWDYVLLQPGKTDLDDSMNEDGRRALERIVLDNVRQPFVFGWHSTWPNPNDPLFFSPEYEVQPPAGYQANLIELYGHDPFVQFSTKVELTRETILKDNTYDVILHPGGGIMNAYAVQGLEQVDLWRDYTHLSDYGRLIAAYTIIAQFTGKPIESIGIESIPASLRHRRFRAQGDLIVTEEMKGYIIAAANAVLEDPWVTYQKPTH